MFGNKMPISEVRLWRALSFSFWLCCSFWRKVYIRPSIRETYIERGIAGRCHRAAPKLLVEEDVKTGDAVEASQGGFFTSLG